MEYVQPEDLDSPSVQPPCEADDGTVSKSKSTTGDDQRLFPLRDFNVSTHQDVIPSRVADETDENSATHKHTSTSSDSNDPPKSFPVLTLPKNPKEEGKPVVRVNVRPKVECKPDAKPPYVTAADWWDNHGPAQRLSAINANRKTLGAARVAHTTK